MILSPDAHILDSTLTIAPDLVQITADEIALVFDYDPLIAQIDQIAREQKYETQEYLMTLIVRACADYDQIAALDVCLRKQPVLAHSEWIHLPFRASELEAAASRRWVLSVRCELVSG